MKHTIVPYRVIGLLKVNETRTHFFALKQDLQKLYDRYGHGLTKIFHILLKINHIVFEKQLKCRQRMCEGAYRASSNEVKEALSTYPAI